MEDDKKSLHGNIVSIGFVKLFHKYISFEPSKERELEMAAGRSWEPDS